MTEYRPEMFEEIMSGLKEIEGFMDKIAKNDRAKKNSQIHFTLDTDLMNELRKEAKETGMSISEICRQKLRDSEQLKEIKKDLEGLKRLMDSFENRKN